ncbi:hypothetical protein RD792_001507 [Penstemon davidsonii]|uniref:protein-serine/threonine phosphatase n=1 Tax=Penstemon davidsonii TaxID=160366 RepID=A0ABR0DNJ6_9LAMI|nr:hypothetical protein RD792_001507 [Penstemon davidsonii]
MISSISVKEKKKAIFIVRKARKARRKRLEIQKLKKSAILNIPINYSKETSKKLESQYLSTSSSLSISSSSDSGGAEKDDENVGGSLVCGHVSMMGRRRVMEDAVTVAPPGWLSGEYSFFAVYDGHGGSKVAETCSERLHKCLEKHIVEARESKDKDFDWVKVMVDCFSGIDELFKEAERGGTTGGGTEKIRMGSTAVVVLVGKEEVVVANCGDSRAVLCRGGAALPLSTDHKPDRPDEKERVEAAGGNILNWNGWRVQGVLATSRSLGDHYLKPYVTCEPEVTVLRRTESDSFLIVASDGLWDVVCNEVACEVVRKCLSGQVRRRGPSDGGSGVSEAAAMLAELAIAKGSKDNISVIVVKLK